MITEYDIKTTFSETDIMKTDKEQKLFTIILIFYWLGILIATHISVPNWTRQMGMSDKTMHFAAYMILTLLLWLGTSFEIKADWKRLRPWLLSVIVLIYGAADELSQHFMNRSTDIKDFAANLAGMAAGMAIVSFLSAHHIIMIIITVCPLFAPSIVKAKLIAQGSILEIAAYAAGFVIITTAWKIYLSSIFRLNLRKNKLLPIFFAPPIGIVLIVKIYAQFTGKPFDMNAILSSLVSIILTLLFWCLISKNKAAI